MLLNQNVLSRKQKSGINFYNRDGKITLMKRVWSSHMFAETFGDIYTHGAAAKPVSIATVKEYEKRMKEPQQMKFNYNQSNRFMKLFRTKVR